MWCEIQKRNKCIFNATHLETFGEKYKRSKLLFQWMTKIPTLYDKRKYWYDNMWQTCRADVIRDVIVFYSKTAHTISRKNTGYRQQQKLPFFFFFVVGFIGVMSVIWLATCFVVVNSRQDQAGMPWPSFLRAHWPVFYYRSDKEPKLPPPADVASHKVMTAFLKWGPGCALLQVRVMGDADMILLWLGRPKHAMLLRYEPCVYVACVVARAKPAWWYFPFG